MDSTLHFSQALPLQLKGGMFSLMVLELTTTAESYLQVQLEKLHQKMPDLFKNTPIVLNLDQLSQDMSPINFDRIKSLCQSFSLNIIAVKGASYAQQQSAIAAGLAVFPDSRRKSAIDDDRRKHADINLTSDTPLNKTNSGYNEQLNTLQPALIIDTPVRSGQQICHAGDVVIMAPVSTGAEILAAGNIHIYNTLRGRVLAGINGNKNARIFCQQFEAELVSICGHFKPITSTSNEGWQQSVQIYLQDGYFRFKTL